MRTSNVTVFSFFQSDIAGPRRPPMPPPIVTQLPFNPPPPQLYIENKYYIPPHYPTYNRFPSEWLPSPTPKYPHLHAKKHLPIAPRGKASDVADVEVVGDRDIDVRKNSRTSIKESSHRKSKTKRRHNHSLDSDMDSAKPERGRRAKKRRGAAATIDDGHSSRSGHAVHVYSSSDDDCIETTTREDLRAALNIQSSRADGLGSTTLEQKLKTELRQRKRAGTRKTRSKSNDQCDHDRGRRHRNQEKCARVDGIDVDSSISDLFQTLTQEKLIDLDRMKMTAVEERQFHEIWKGRSSLKNPPTNGIAHSDQGDLDDEDEDDDETVSLEEQELRLIALKSAVLKKHEARKKRRIAQDERPYSPTDNLLTPDRMSINISDIEDNDNGDANDSDNNNMEISPAVSPRSTNVQKPEVECQPMDMELAQSDESKSPLFFNEIPMPNDNTNSCCDTSIDNLNTNVALDHSNASAALNVTDAIEEALVDAPNEPLIADDEESSLRAILIATMKTTKKTVKSNEVSEPQSVVIANATAETMDDASEAEDLRNFLLSSIQNKPKKRTVNATVAEAELNEPASKKTVIAVEPLSLPRLACNLKGALKRLQHKQEDQRSVSTDKDDNSPPIHDSTMPSKPESNENSPAPVQVKCDTVVADTPQAAATTNTPLTKIQKPLIFKAKMPLNNTSVNIQKRAVVKLASVPAKNAIIATSAKVIKPNLNLSNAAGPGALKTHAIITKTITKNTRTQKINSITTKKMITSNSTSPIAIVKQSIARVASPLLAKTAVMAIRPRTATPPSVNKSSKLIHVMEPKPVPKMIIYLNHDSSSDWSLSGLDDDDDDNEVAKLNRTKKIDMFDIRSPGCIAINTPSSASNSPAVDFRPIDANGTDAVATSDTNAGETNDDAFQLRLNDYLKSVRSTLVQDTKADDTPSSVVADAPNRTEKKSAVAHTAKSKVDVAKKVAVSSPKPPGNSVSLVSVHN